MQWRPPYCGWSNNPPWLCYIIVLWLRIAAQLPTVPVESMSQAAKHRDELAAKLTNTQHEKAQELAKFWKPVK